MGLTIKKDPWIWLVNDAASSQRLAARQYFPEIDGLRAIAVLMVVFFHLNVSRVPGGFVGVDIFFVISGYLISSILLSSLKHERFSLMQFYERRIRRIAPALTLLLLVISIVAYFALLPLEYIDLMRSELAAVLSASNLYFLLTSNYFAAPSLTKPLLHTWSLGVEEQFYLFFPPLFALCWRRSRHLLLPILAVLAGLSFVLCFSLTTSHQALAFYSPLTRAFEFLLGSLVSLTAFPVLERRAVRNIAACAGLSLILFSAGYFSQFTLFPGRAVLLPVGGTTLLLACFVAGPTWIAQQLSFRPLVRIGQASYSLYLWHWPLIVFVSLGLSPLGALSSAWTKVFLFATSLGLALLSWKFVEQPFRHPASAPRQRTVYLGAFLSVALVCALCAFVFFAQGFPHRYSKEALNAAGILSRLQDDSLWHYRQGVCFIVPDDKRFNDYDRSSCLNIVVGRPNILILGDSHAAQLYPGLHQAYPNYNFLQATSAGCKPTIDQARMVQPGCVRLMNSIFHDFLPQHTDVTVLIGARWDAADVQQLGKTMDYLHAHKIPVVIFGPNMQYDVPLPRLLLMAAKWNAPKFPERHRLEGYRELDERMAMLASHTWHTPYVSYFTILCEQSKCLTSNPDGSPLLGDGEHLTASGSVTFAARLKIREPSILR